jgi:hypothetical protein
MLLDVGREKELFFVSQNPWQKERQFLSKMLSNSVACWLL